MIIVSATPRRRRGTLHSLPELAASRALRLWSGVPQKALVDFTRGFAVMLRARLSLVQSLTTAVAQCQNPALRRILETVLRDVKRGSSLSESLARHGGVFDGLYVHLARVGERAGILDDVLLRLAAHLEKAAALKQKISMALLYPGLITAVAAAAVVFFLTTIAPTFAEMYADFDQELPGPTRAVLRLSEVLTAYFPVAMLGLGLASGGTWMLLRSAPGRFTWGRLKLRLPLVGSLMRKSLTARFCRTLGTLLRSSVALVEALSMLTKADGNAYVEQALREVVGQVRRGRSLYEPLKAVGLFPDIVLHLIAVGEQTAELDAMLLHAAEYYEQEVGVSLEGLTSLIEPVLTVGIGLILGGILVSLYLPMFELINTVG